MINPEDLKLLAEAMGKEAVIGGDPDQNPIGCYLINDHLVTKQFEPHIDKSQAFEVLEWMVRIADVSKEEMQDIFTVDWCRLDREQGIDGRLYSKSLPESITLAAIEMVKGER